MDRQLQTAGTFPRCLIFTTAAVREKGIFFGTEAHNNRIGKRKRQGGSDSAARGKIDDTLKSAGWNSLVANKGLDAFTAKIADGANSDFILKVFDRSDSNGAKKLVWADMSHSGTSDWTSVEDTVGANDRGWYYRSDPTDPEYTNTTYFKNGEDVTFNARGAANRTVNLAEGIKAGTIYLEAGDYTYASAGGYALSADGKLDNPRQLRQYHRHRVERTWQLTVHRQLRRCRQNSGHERSRRFQRLQQSGALHHVHFSDSSDRIICEIARAVPEGEGRKKFLSAFRRKSLLTAFSQNILSGRLNLFNNVGRRWLRMEYFLLKNPDSGHVEALLYAFDIQNQILSERMLSIISQRFFDYIGCIDVKTESCKVCYYSQKYQKQPDSVEGRYAAMCEQQIRPRCAGDAEAEMAAQDLKLVLRKLEKSIFYSAIIHVRDELGNVRAIKITFICLDEMRQRIIVAQSDVQRVHEIFSVMQSKDAFDTPHA